ncbi:MAG: cytochrome c biogenesis protein CcdA [Bacteroidaceae bacterium]
MQKRFIASLLIFLGSVSLLFAQIEEPVHFSTSLKKIDKTHIQIIFNGTIDPGWHVYSTLLGDGPISATFNIDQAKGIEVQDKLQALGEEIEANDPVFAMKVRFFEHTVQFVQNLKIQGDAYDIKGYLEYGACNDKSCLPPIPVEFHYSEGDVSSLIEQKAGKDVISRVDSTSNTSLSNNLVDETSTENSSDVLTQSANQSQNKIFDQTLSSESKSLWQPVVQKLHSFGSQHEMTNRSWIYIFFAGFVGGLLALLTPCVWPIIPMTVSFFLKRNKDRMKGIKDAITYGISIIVIYLILGLAITFIFGASALNSLATNALFNILFCLMLLVFAASFLGGFEITLPSSWTNAVDNKSEKTSGLLSIFLMAFTLALVSFSCTGPIIGFLLVEVSTTGSVVGPAVGMFGFALALALPFTLFALFPTMLKTLPKSGGWMNVIKVSLGFLELAFALKFFSVADLAYSWHLLDREVFLSLWIIIFSILGLYLLGLVKFPHDDDNRKIGVTRFFMALASLAFALYMIPGLWGAPLKAVSAFSPPMNTQDFNLYNKDIHAQFTDYEEGMRYAKRHNKPVMLDFTGYGCVNCRKMEIAVWTDFKVSDIINNDYVLITLYVDNKTRLKKSISIEENGKTRTLRTLGDKWSYLQRVKFGANAQPFYVLIDNEGTPLNSSYGYNEDIPSYIDFLNVGLSNYK